MGHTPLAFDNGNLLRKLNFKSGIATTKKAKAINFNNNSLLRHIEIKKPPPKMRYHYSTYHDCPY